MIAVIDVGNTNIVIGAYEGKVLLSHWRMATEWDRTSDELGIFFTNCFKNSGLNLRDAKGVIISSVVPPIMYSLEHAIRSYSGLEPIIIEPGIRTGINIKTENPREVGADRIVDAVAGFELYGGPLIIVDFGTATTVCAINSKGDYLGGAICPGIKVSAEALFQKAAKLPRIELAKPESVIGRNTVAAMQSGIIYGYAGMVDNVVKRMKKEIGEENCKVIATGGMARMISGESEMIDEINSFLTLEGLRIIYERNR